jgi:DNA modification methylase
MEPYFKTSRGKGYLSSIEDFLDSKEGRLLKGKVNLIFTSPPFPLVIPKKYGNRQGSDYLDWMANIASRLSELLTEDGSMVIEIGNAWEKKSPTMSTLPIETLISISQTANLNICQQFVWNNPSKLPGPAYWVNVKRQRITDSFTHIWWYSKTDSPKANNRNVLQPYKPGMEKLIAKQKYNSGERPSGHKVSEKGFLTHNGGSIPQSLLNYANTGTDSKYRDWCNSKGLPMHPARMPITVADFFIKFLTDPKDLVLDPFGGSCTTGRSAESLNRRWICIEKERDYLRGAKGRFL